MSYLLKASLPSLPVRHSRLCLRKARQHSSWVRSSRTDGVCRGRPQDASVIDLGQGQCALKTHRRRSRRRRTEGSHRALRHCRARAYRRDPRQHQTARRGWACGIHLTTLTSLKTLRRLMYPTTMVNVAVNYRAHVPRWPVEHSVRRTPRPVTQCCTTSAHWNLGAQAGRKRWNRTCS